MSVATKTIKIDLWRALLEPIKVVQREAAGRTLAFQITDGGSAYALTGKVVTFYATKPDGTTLFNAVTVIDEATGKINYTMTSQTVVAPGALACTLIITASGEETRTQPFTVTIIASPDYTSAVESASEFTALVALTGQIMDHETRIDAAEIDIDVAEAAITLKADKAEVTNVMTPKGNIAYASLPTTGNTVGWYYYCADGDGTNGAGNYVWNGTAWYFGGTGDEGYNIVRGKIDYLGKQVTQYIDAYGFDFDNYYYYTGSAFVGTTSTSYKSIYVANMPAGTYHVNWMSAPLTWFENVATSAVSRASTDMGFSDITGVDTEITIPFNFNLYLTVALSSADTRLTLWSDGNLPLSYEYGVFTFEASDALKSNFPRTFYVGSTREFTTLKAGMEEAVKYFDSVVYVDAGTYDLVAEFGQTYLDDYTDTYTMIGIWLKNRVHVIFASGAKVVFNYTGANVVAQTNFSPFNTAEHGFTLENAWVESTNCRYSVHDERWQYTDSYHNIYKRCTLIHDSSGTTWGGHQAIGGGLGLHGDILIDGGYFSAASNGEPISYHNSTILGIQTKSKVVIRDAYIEGRVLCSNYGDSTEKSQMYVMGCSLAAAPYLETVITAERVDNMELFAWNNEIRA